MKAAMFYGKEDLRIEDVPEPAVGPGQVKIRNGYVGICGGDVHTYFHPEASPVDLFRPHPVTGARLPQPLGHEFSGTVVEVGEGVTGIEVGDRGSMFPTAYSCGTCTACRLPASPARHTAPTAGPGFRTARLGPRERRRAR
ncbi:alcohol dehydrogenase catalytic domain-containing protein [Streptomyces sp. SID5998]|nr:alcohol dehydrogenase catalytic domain-containing protein [Streptomyces sp. SID5998]